LSQFSKVPLGKAALSIIDGDRGTNYPKKTEFFPKGDCWFLNTSNVKSAGFDFGEMDFITAEKDAALSKGKLRRHDIVLTTRGTIGNCAYFGENIPFDHIRINSGMVVLRADPTQLDPYFLYAFLRSEIFKIQTGTHSSGSAQPQLPIGALRNIVIPLFDLPHQRKIAAVLYALDAKIALNHRINSELEGMAKLLYDYWFVQYDFPLSAAQAAALGKPHLTGQPYRSSGGPMVYNPQLKREIPEGWVVKHIDAILAKEAPSKKIPASEILKSGSIPVIDQSKDFICGFTNDEDALICGSPKIIFGDHTRILKFINFDFARGADGTQMIASNSESMPPHLFYHSLLKIDLSNYGYARHFKFLKQSNITLPDSSIAQKFEEIVAAHYELMRANTFQNQELTTLRDWLLPMLMNGQVRVG
jgi:type I restriction enzyme, S subunit